MVTILTTNLLIVSVVVIFSRVIFVFSFLLGMVMYAYEIETTKTKNYLR